MPTNDRELYWISSGDVPIGPFDAAEIQAKLAASEFTTTAKACCVGGEEWMPIEKVLAVASRDENDAVVTGPPEPASPSAIGSPSPPVGDSAPIKTSPAVTFKYRKETRIAAAVLAVCGVIWLTSWWLTPLTPRQVVQRFAGADGAEEGLRYATLNLRPALLALEQVEDTSDPSDRFELTQDKPAPPDVGGHYVGCRFHFRDEQTKLLVQGEGVFHLIDADGWKIDDLFFTGINGEALPEPLSMARDYRKVVADLPRKAKPPAPPGKRLPGEIIAEGLFGKQIANWLKTGVGRFTAFSVVMLIVAYDYYRKRKNGTGFL